MENILYIDCFSGISGDMMLGALMDLGLDKKTLLDELGKMDIEGYAIDIDDLKVNGMHAKKVTVKTQKDQPPRDYSQIKDLLSKSKLSSGIKSLALRIFDEIARAESIVHGTDISSVHFHEIGALDSIIDITSTAIGIEFLGIKRIISSEIPLGKGFADSLHGRIPVPAPATLEIVKGLPVYGGGFDFEVTTPTGAAIIKVLAEHFGELPDFKPQRIGIGSGSRINQEIPNILRLIKGKKTSLFAYQGLKKLFRLSTNIDDLSPELAATMFEELGENGALDVWIENIYMKKNRPGLMLNAICGKEDIDRLSDIIFTNTTTFGLRIEKFGRKELKREIKKVELPYGSVRVKLGYLDGKKVTISPEFEDCLKLHQETKKPLKEIYQDVVYSFRENNT